MSPLACDLQVPNKKAMRSRRPLCTFSGHQSTTYTNDADTDSERDSMSLNASAYC